MTALAPWLKPVWPAPARVRALMTTRAGGHSSPPFDTLNLGDHVGDDTAAVCANRHTLAQALGARPVFWRQVHGAQCEVVGLATPDGGEADACVTTEPGVACVVMVADCLPVLLCDSQGLAVGAAHAGWRGLAGAGQGAQGGVLPHFYETFCAKRQLGIAQAAINKNTSHILAWLGPCIGPEAFEVGSEVRDAFLSAPYLGPRVTSCFWPVAGRPGFFHCDLAGLARLQLRALGVDEVHGNDGTAPWCTASQPSVWFSHRRDAALLGSTGRMAACIWLE